MRIKFFAPVQQIIEADPKHREESMEDESDTTSTLSDGSNSSDGSLDQHLELEFNEDGTPIPSFSLDQDNALNKFFSSPLEPDMVMDFWTTHIIARCWSVLDARAYDPPTVSCEASLILHIFPVPVRFGDAAAARA